MLLRVRASVLLFAALPFQVGCHLNHFNLQPTPPPEITNKVNNNLFAGDWLNTYHANIASGKCPIGNFSNAPISGVCPTGTLAVEQQAYRNGFIDAIEAKIDDRYRPFRTNLYSSNAYLSFGADLATLGLSGAGSVVGDAGVASILAVTTSGVTGATASYNKQVLNQQNTLAIIAAMDSERQSVVTVIVQGEGKPVTAYTLEAALVDLRNLFNQGTVISALEGIQGTAAAKKEVEVDKQKRLRGFR